MVTYAIEAIVNSGITEIMVVTGGRTRASSSACSATATRTGSNGSRTPTRSGIRHQDALGLAERFAAGDRVLVMLADNVFGQSIRPAVDNYAKQERGARIVLARQEEHLRHSASPSSTGTSRPHRRAGEPCERPRGDGLYLYDASVFEYVQRLSPSARGEHRDHDVNNWFIEGLMEYDVLEGFWATPASRSTPTTR